MKMRAILTFLFPVLLPYLAFAQNGQPDEHMDLFLRIILLFALLAAIGVVLLGALLCYLLALTLVALAGAGIISVSVLAGLYRRSVAAGFRTFLLLSCISAGAFLGALIAWLLPRLTPVSLSVDHSLLWGLLGGALGGWFLSRVVLFIGRKLLGRFAGRPKLFGNK